MILACLDVINYSTVTVKDNSWILEMVNSGNAMLHGLIRNGNSELNSLLPVRGLPVLRIFLLSFQSCHPGAPEGAFLMFARLASSDCLSFLNFLHQALFIHSALIS